MKPVKITLQTLNTLQGLTIIPLGDCHLGSPEANRAYAQTQVNRAIREPETYLVICGDIIDLATKCSPGSPYEDDKPMNQIQEALDLLEPVKNKVLAFVSGNHEQRLAKEAGVDLCWLLAKQLGIESRYDPFGVVLFLRIGEGTEHKGRPVPYTIYITHGKGSGRTTGSKVNKLIELASIVDCDIYIHAHSHLPAVVRQAFYRIDTTNSDCRKVDKLFVNTASCLDYGGYGEAGQYVPCSNLYPAIYLGGRKKTYTAEV